MRVLVLGAAGNLGRRLLTRGLAHGHEVTAFVRSRDRLIERMEGGSHGGLRIIEGDLLDAGVLAHAMRDHDIVVSAAGHVTDGERFVELFRAIVAASEQQLPPPRRLWMLAGAAALSIPHTGRTGVALPGVPNVYRLHEVNWRQLEASRTDWTLVCPGPMVTDENWQPRTDLRVSFDVAPYDVGTWAKWAPPVALSLMMKSRLPELIVSYDDVAELIMANLAAGGPFSRRRVGLALPAGQRGRKDHWTLGRRGAET